MNPSPPPDDGGEKKAFKDAFSDAVIPRIAPDKNPKSGCRDMREEWEQQIKEMKQVIEQTQG
jgi:hypothetical protein